MSLPSTQSSESEEYDDDYYDEAARDEAVDGGEDSSAEDPDDDDDTPLEEDAEEPDHIDVSTVSKHNKEIIVVTPGLRRTSSVMSKFEMTENVSIRATEIAQYSNCMVDITGLDDPIKMAKRELMMRMSPLTLRRYVGERKNARGGSDSYYEMWDPNEMTFAVTYTDVL